MELKISKFIIMYCSDTTLTGESRFHISTPLGIWTWVPCDRKQTGSPLNQWDMVRMCAPPQQSTLLVVKLEGGPAESVKPGQKSYVRSSGIITLSARGPSDGSGWSPPQTRPQKWSITSGLPMLQDNTNRRIPVSHKYPPGDLNLGPLWREANR